MQFSFFFLSNITLFNININFKWAQDDSKGNQNV